MPSTPSPQPRERILALGLLAWLAAALFGPAVIQPASYHEFADTRTLLGVPNALDVLTNAAFAIVAVALLDALRRVRAGLAPAQTAALAVLALGLIATALGSGVYHLRPNDLGLALDRVGMSLAFGGVIGVAAAERFPARIALGLGILATIGGLSGTAGALASGDIWVWSLVQGGGALFIAASLVLTPNASALGVRWWPVLLAYAAAKALEGLDAPVLAVTGGLISGHSLKHLVAAAAILPIVLALRRIASRSR